MSRQQDLQAGVLLHSESIIQSVREEVEKKEILSYGEEHLPAGPAVGTSDSIYKVLECLTNFLIILFNLYYKAINPIIIEYILPQCGFMAKFIDGVVEKPDVVGAIFGQTEGLLGEELDLRDLQKSGKLPYSFRDTGALYSYSVFYTIS